ncbi:hypothetical protein PROFUN_05319 [Planoprotostelium fungivorum]|uniref:Uncharacterized protein n=1 Tax=Planoprotostelium fungivorum TaxID=1890364 RepID=A0A2P6NR39_9EUKA|nr:hypothetical protein PROFUN_05319 [Planoprotostelium fungivorum]
MTSLSIYRAKIKTRLNELKENIDVEAVISLLHDERYTPYVYVLHSTPNQNLVRSIHAALRYPIPVLYRDPVWETIRHTLLRKLFGHPHPVPLVRLIYDQNHIHYLVNWVHAHRCLQQMRSYQLSTVTETIPVTRMTERARLDLQERVVAETLSITVREKCAVKIFDRSSHLMLAVWYEQPNASDAILARPGEYALYPMSERAHVYKWSLQASLGEYLDTSAQV